MEETGDKYCETDKKRAWSLDHAVKIEYGEEGTIEATPSVTIMTMFKQTVDDSPDHKALAYKEAKNKPWKLITFKEYYHHVKDTAKAFIKIGLDPYGAVGIMAFNSKEWFYSCIGAIFAGGLSMGLYTSSPTESVEFILSNTKANICMVDGDAQLTKVLQVWDKVPSLKAVINYSSTKTSLPLTAEQEGKIYMWEDFLKLGESVSDEILNERMGSQCVNRCCTLMFTSGTTGPHKAVMLSHDNITYSVHVIREHTRMKHQSIISYLPVGHTSAQHLDMYLPLHSASTTYFASPDALKGELNATMRDVRPTQFFSLPRVYNKIDEKVGQGLSQLGYIKQKLIGWARNVIDKQALSVMNGSRPTLSYKIAQKITRPIREKLGMDKVTFLSSGASELSRDLHQSYFTAGLPISGVYGMSECFGVTIINISQPHLCHFKACSAGYPVPGYNVRVCDEDKVTGHGEVAVKGRHVFMGYLDEEKWTLAAFDEDGWFRTADLGYWDEDGFLFMTGRIKDAIKLLGSHVVTHAGKVEEALKDLLPHISNCLVIGDQRKFLAALITLKVVVNMETMHPTENFTPETIEWLKSIGSEAVVKVPEIKDGKDPAVTKAIGDVIEKLNSKNNLKEHNIEKFALLPYDFSLKGGELGPTLKVKRHFVIEKCANIIKQIYEEN